MKKTTKPEKVGESLSYLKVTGFVTYDLKSYPINNATVMFVSKTNDKKSKVQSTTDKSGYYELQLPIAEEYECCFTGSLIVQNEMGVIIHQSETLELYVNKEETSINVIIPYSSHQIKKENLRRTIKVGDLNLDAIELANLKPEDLYTIATVFVNMHKDKTLPKKIAALSPHLVMVERDANEKGVSSGTSILNTIYEIIKYKKWPREVRLQVEEIISMRAFGFNFVTHDCGNFLISYDTTGAAAVNTSTAAEDVIDPGSNPQVILATLPAGGVPTYIKRICFWLERALAAYINPPFSLLNPAAGGKIPVTVNTSPYGSATPSGFFINNNLAPDLLCAVTVHELFHMVQFQYGGSGTWWSSMLEGGAVFAEDSAADSMNRYLDEAGTNFNGIGVLDNPNISLQSAAYKCSLFWRYIAEQQSPRITPADEPTIGVETYRTLIEKCALNGGTFSTNNIKDAIRTLPWYQDFYEFSYLDPSRLDRLTSETTFGNYVLACYLKQLGTNVPDRRFDFMEDTDNIYIDDVIHAVNPSTPLQTQLAQVHLSGTNTVNTSGTVSFMGTVNKFASQYFEVAVNPNVTNVQITFTANAGLSSCLFQIAQIDEDNLVRDINRTDKTAYSKRITNLRGAKKLSKLLLVVSGADSSGSFSITAQSAAPSTDVMVTKWHSIMKNEYEIDSRNWAWTWVSPDIWVDNDANGVADSEVFFNFNNKLTIRLHNKGNANASNIQVQFYYQDASGGLSNPAWMPVTNLGGITQVLTGLTLAQGASNNFVVDWSPVPSGMSNHFCVRAIVTVPGDPNTDNKNVQSNFGNVKVQFGGFSDISFVRRNTLAEKSNVTLQVISRIGRNFKMSLSDIQENKTQLIESKGITKDVIRMYHIPESDNKNAKELRSTYYKASKFATKPDPLGFYATPKEALPPGVDPKSLITIVHEVNGRPLGGITFQVKLGEERKVRKSETKAISKKKKK
jgi:hypothetical protein